MQTLLIAFYKLLDAYSFILMAYAVLSWFPNARGSKLGEWINRLCEPTMEVFDRFVPSFGGISFSVVVAILFIQLAQKGLAILLAYL